MSHRSINRGGKTYFLVEQGEYEKLFGGASHMPTLPKPNSDGTVDAVEYARASIAREIITRRQAAGMSQTELAKAAGVRVETLNRIENARHTADVATLAKLDAALAARSSGSKPPPAGRRAAKREAVNRATDKPSVRRAAFGPPKSGDRAGNAYRRSSARGSSKRTATRKK